MLFAIRPAGVADAGRISRLVTDSARRFIPDVTSPDVQPFLASLDPQATADRIGSSSYSHQVAERDGHLCGVIAIRDRSHLYHLFVRRQWRRQGVARALWSHARDRACQDRITVNASLPAVPVYERLGFVIAGTQQVQHGIALIPMVWAHGV